MSSITFELDRKQSYPRVAMYINDVEKAEFVFAGEGCGTYRVENVNIDSDIRGRGFYKMLILAAFNLVPGMDIIRSEQRNQNSNPAYEKWCGQELEWADVVYIQREGESLVFTVDTYVED